MLGQPHRKKRRLTKREEDGHRNAVVVEFWPGDIILLGNLIGGIYPNEPNPFEVFPKIGDWRCYDDELLVISHDEALLWRLEIEIVQQSLLGFGVMPVDKIQKLIVAFLRYELGTRSDLERRLEQAAAEMPSSPATFFLENIRRQSRPTAESTVEQIQGALSDAEKLCSASTETGNPIRLLW